MIVLEEWLRAAGRIGMVSVLWLGTGGCHETMLPRSAHMTSPGVSIVGEGFLLQSGGEFAIPFALDEWKRDPKTDIVYAFAEKLSEGAKRVRVDLPNGAQYVGVLSVHRIPEDSRGPATRSYSFAIPPGHFEAASDGRISVIYELVPSGSNQYYAWVLWLSDRPF